MELIDVSRTIYLWGDSIGSGIIYHEARKRYCLAKERCTALLQADGMQLISHARMGATIGWGYADFCASDTTPGSILVIEFGGNDCDLDWDSVAAHPERLHDARTPLPEFAAVLRLFILEARRRGLTPVVALPPPLEPERYFNWIARGRDEKALLAYLRDKAHIYRWHERYARQAEATARELFCQVVDLREPFLQAVDFPALMCADGIHPNEAGQMLMARSVMEWARGNPLSA